MARYNVEPADDRASGASTSSNVQPGRSDSAPVDDRVVAPANGYITIPDMFGAMRGQAANMLHRAGLLGDITYESNQCEDSVVHGRVMERQTSYGTSGA